MLLRLDRKGEFKFAALQSKTGKKALELCFRQNSDISSIVYIDGDVDLEARSMTTKTLPHFIKSEAIVQICKRLGIPIHLLSWILPKIVKDGAYDIVAENRYSLMGKYDECKLYSLEYSDRFLQD